MAVTTYGVNDPLAVKLWSRRLMVEVLKNTWISKFMGNDSGSMIQVKDETNKGPGDKITYGLRMQLTGAGVLGDGTLEGFEESLSTYNDSITINQIRHAVRSGGRMSQQRVPFSIRDEALSGLRDWFADRIDTSGINQLAGNTVETDVRFTGLVATTNVSDSNHEAFVGSAGNAGTDQSISTTETFTLGVIDKAVERARVITPAIRPIMMGGKSYYVGILHPYQVTSMRTSATTGQWMDIQKAAMTGGEIDDNPLFDGSLGMYNGVILHSDSRVPLGVTSTATTTAVASTRRAIFAGAQAGVCAYGQENGPERYTWVEELFDYENQLGVSAGLIWGLKKAVFNSTDFAVIVMASYATAS